jgi:hypothetical protein
MTRQVSTREIRLSLYKPMPKHWYRMYIGECPCCGRDKSYRERVYGEPPADPRDRYVHLPDTQTFDGCIY